MPSNQTANYALNQWSKDDRVLMEDFNADNVKIDTAIKAEAARLEQAITAKSVVVTGAYTGDGQETRFIDLGATPRAIFMLSASGNTDTTNGSVRLGGIALLDHPLRYSNRVIMEVVEGGFQVYYRSGQYAYTNAPNYNFHYIAIM